MYSLISPIRESNLKVLTSSGLYVFVNTLFVTWCLYSTLSPVTRLNYFRNPSNIISRKVANFTQLNLFVTSLGLLI